MRKKSNSNQIPVEYLLQQFRTIYEMYKSDFILSKIEPKYTDNLFTFKNNVPSTLERSKVSQKYFSSAEQYLALLKARSYHFLLKDYSICKFHYEFDSSRKLMSYNLLWFPCPFSTEVLNDMDSASTSGNVLEYIDELTIEDKFSYDEIVLRTPIRVDYDINYDGTKPFFHPTSHIHFQNKNTRAKNGSIFCLYNFFLFIIENCYPDEHYTFNTDERNISLEMKNEYSFWLREARKVKEGFGNEINTIFKF